MKQDIIDYFVNKGFKHKDNLLTKEEKQVVRQVIINEQCHNEEAIIKIKLEYIGEGAVDDVPYDQYSVMVNDEHQGDFLFKDIDDVKFFFEYQPKKSKKNRIIEDI